MEVRQLFSVGDIEKLGMSKAQLRWALKTGDWQRVDRGVFMRGGLPPTDVERALAIVVRTDGVASHTLAGVLHELDGISLGELVCIRAYESRSSIKRTCTRDMPDGYIDLVHGLKCTNGLRTLVDLSSIVSDTIWEQALESVLRKRKATYGGIEEAVELHRPNRVAGARRIRRVLALRPADVPPTESRLETLMVQLIRSTTGLPEPVRQHEVFDSWGGFVARVDLAYPDLGVFVELDGQHHKDQPVYDARRETAVVAATGWLPARFTWTEINNVPMTSARRLREILDQARRKHNAA